MHVDVQGLCSDDQSLVGPIGTILSDYPIDNWAGQTALTKDGLGNSIPSEPGGGENVHMFARMTADLDSAGGASTVEAQLVEADDEGLTTNVNILARSGVIAEATAIKGYWFPLPDVLPAGNGKKWTGFRYVTAGEAVTAGTVSAGVGQGLKQRGWLQP